MDRRVVRANNLARAARYIGSNLGAIREAYLVLMDQYIEDLDDGVLEIIETGNDQVDDLAIATLYLVTNNDAILARYVAIDDDRQLRIGQRLLDFYILERRGVFPPGSLERLLLSEYTLFSRAQILSFIPEEGYGIELRTFVSNLPSLQGADLALENGEVVLEPNAVAPRLPVAATLPRNPSLASLTTNRMPNTNTPLLDALNTNPAAAFNIRRNAGRRRH